MDVLKNSVKQINEQSNFFTIFGFLVTVLYIPRVAITLVAQSEFFNKDYLACTPNSTLDSEYGSLRQRCYVKFATSWPPHYHWFMQLGLTIGVLICFYFPSLWSIKHKKNISKNVERGYLVQTAIRAVFETCFIVSQGFLYGFEVDSKFVCSVDNRRIQCDVLRVIGRVAMLVAMFVISIVVLGLLVADFTYGIWTLRANDGSLLPVLEDTVKEKSHCERPPDPVEDVIRCENYTKLEKKLKKETFVILSGLSGSGKTQLALLYAKKFIHEHKDSTCFKFNSKSPEDVLVDGKKLIDQCKLDIHSPDSGKGGEDSMENKAWRLLVRIREDLVKDNTKTLFIFDNATFEIICIIKEVFISSSSFIVIITSTDPSLKGFYNDLKIEIKGYSDADVNTLSICQYKKFNHDIQKLAKRLNFLPLGIHAACQYIIESKEAIPELPNQLDDNPINGLFQMLYRKALATCKDIKVSLLLNIVALLSLDPIPFDVLDWTIRVSYQSKHDDTEKTNENGNISSKSDETIDKRNKFLDIIKRFHLGTVETNGSDTKMLRMHSAAVLALRKAWEPDELIKYYTQMLLVLDDQADKDTRSSKDFLYFLKLIPHVKHALKDEYLTLGRKAKDLGIQILQISLQDKLYYMYTQTKLIGYFKENESKAKKLCYLLINQNLSPEDAEAIVDNEVRKGTWDTLQDIELTESNVDDEGQRGMPGTVQSYGELTEVGSNLEKQVNINQTDLEFIQKKAELIYNKLDELEVPVEPLDYIQELICTRRLDKGNVELLQNKMKEWSNRKCCNILCQRKDDKTDPDYPSQNLPNDYLIESRYKYLEEKGLAISLEKMRKMFLLELMASILYTHGRMYFYKDDNKEEASVYEHDLRLAYELSALIKKEHDKSIVTLLLAKRNGFLYIDVKSKDSERIKRATDHYKKLLDEKGEYYEKGLLKIATKDDSYHKTTCRKQLVTCYISAVKCEDDSKKKLKKYDEGCKEARALLKNIKERDKHNRIEAFIKFGDLEMKMSGIHKKYLDKAISKYEKALKLENELTRRGNNRIRALESITEALCERNKKDDWKKAISYATRAIEICTKEKIEKDTIVKLQQLLEVMNSP
ncbi:unnamed protein product [Owenia fusiformis]|uniref:Connexin cysteine-rich domain-containing protein n=1 Tax=Owenia fusiformis TaxID=6347 RepID=A0A8S4Q2L4_OWEFU|nr:unnamed protein product [Owenia fusiformis]